MPIDFDRLRRERQTRLASVTSRAPAAGLGEGGLDDSKEELGFLDTAADVLLAPIRGVEGAAQDIYGLADALTLDALPDWEERVFGESRTRVGGFIEAATNFAAGFVPVYGWLGKAGKAGRFLAGHKILRGAAAGAVADFAVFDGHEQRLSNLVQTFPMLQNPVTEYLAADEDDPELLGRLKNAIEGLGVGGAVDGVLLGFKALRAGRAARAAGASPDAIEEAIEAAVPGDQFAAAYRRLNEMAAEPPPTGALTPPSQPAAIAAQAPLEEAAEAAVEREIPATGEEGTRQVLRTFDIDDAKAQELVDLAAGRTDLGLDPAVVPRNLTPAQRWLQGLQKTDLNLSRYQGPEGALQLLRSMEQALEPFPHLGEASAKTMAEQETEALRELADIVHGGGSGGLESTMQRVLASAQRDLGDLPSVNRRILAYKGSLDTYAAHVKRLSDVLMDPAQATDVARAKFRESLSTLADMELAVKGLLGEQGRGLGANRRPTLAVTELLSRDELSELLTDAGGARRVDDLAAKFRMAYEGGGTAAAVDLARGGIGKRFWAVATEYWYNSLLGRPTTVVVNGLSGLMTSVYRPLETMLGGALTMQADVIADGARQLSGLVQSASEALKVAKAAAASGGNILDPLRKVQDIGNPTFKAISAEGVGIEADSLAGAATDWIGRLVRMPSTALMATDEFVKQLNYRGVARAELMREAVGKGLDPKAAAAFIADGMDRLIYEGQAYGSAQLYHRGVRDAAEKGIKSKAAVHDHARQFALEAAKTGEHQRLSRIGALALDRAQEVTFTKPLRPGSLSHRVQQAVIAHPYLRLVMPFVRTPVNLATFALQRIDAPSVARVMAARRIPAYASALKSSNSRFIQDMLSGNARRSADAVGRFAAGTSITAFVLTKAYEEAADGMPLITGRGPTDPEQRRILEDAGWLPYSIRVGDAYVSYARLDPFASLIGTAADVINFSRYAAEHDQSDAEVLSFGLAVGLANNFTNKTYLTGLANVLEALEDPGRRVPKLFRSLGASFVPGQFAAAVSVDDPVLRDVRSIMEAASARIPGLSDNLPPVRNVLGEPVRRAQSLGAGVSSVANAFLPVLYREVSDDVVNQELRVLGAGLTPPRRDLHGLDLGTIRNDKGQTAYDRWGQLHGEVKLNGRTLRQSLRRLIQSSRYQAIPPESTYDVESPRVGLVRNMVLDYRHESFQQLLREFPEVSLIEQNRKAARRALFSGREIRPLDALRAARQ